VQLKQLKNFSLSGDALLVIPPFAASDLPALGPHTVQASSRAEGFRVHILYANLFVAARLGELIYGALAQASGGLLGERFFAAAAFGGPLLGRTPVEEDRGFRMLLKHFVPDMKPEQLASMAADADQWIDELVDAILTLDFPIVGCSTTFQQTAASISLLRRIKQRCPDIITVLGGANCEGQMAEGILSLDAGVDFVFSGESETSFRKFLSSHRSSTLPGERIIQGEPCRSMNDLPLPDFAEYYDQREHFLPDSLVAKGGNIWLPYESSRGCWWGQKHHCTFCGISESAITFREKSPERVIEDLEILTARHPTNKLCVVDWIMPASYFRELLGLLEAEVPNLHTFYFVKANLSLDNVVALKKAGAAIIQPGIEALSSSLLKRMDKGVSTSQNIALLRYARSVDLAVTWNLLHSFPGDELHEFEETLKLLPLLRHLHPPTGAFDLSIDRFSPYFDNPVKYGVSNIRPSDSYSAVFPADADLAKIAYHFNADFLSASRDNPGLIEKIVAEVEVWRGAWDYESALPALAVTRLTGDQFLLMDTRGIPGAQQIRFLTQRQAALVLAGARERSDDVDWAIENKLVLELDSRIVPLATASSDLIREFESEKPAVRGRVLPVLVSAA